MARGSRSILLVDARCSAGWGEDIENERVGQGFGGVRHVGWEMDHLAGRGDDFSIFRAARLAKAELESALQEARDLLVLMGVRWHETAAGETNVRDHGLGADDPPSLDQWHGTVYREVRPSGYLYGVIG